jgi:hypothetical protein
MEKKPDLTVKLFAGDTLVDESTNVELWQRVLGEIRGLNVPKPPDHTEDESVEPKVGTKTSPLAAFAKSINVTVDEITGSLGPTSAAPFIHLDNHDWEALKRNTPAKGSGSISSSVLAATALVLWQKHSAIGDVTLQAVRAVMSTIDLDDQNAARSVNNCEWLQSRNNRIALNPSRSSAATRLIRAYCKREPLSEAN